MCEHLFKQLKQQLLIRGFSRKYVNQLVDELLDHHQSIVEELKYSGLNHEEANKQALDQLGKEERILAEVLSRKELMPFIKKRPLFTFVFLPVLLIALGILIVLVAPISILDSLFPNMSTKQIINSGFIQLLHVLTFIIAYFTPAVAMLLFCYLADRFAVSLNWLAASTGIIAMIGSMLVFTLYYPSSQELETLRLNDLKVPSEGGLILNGGFWSDYGANYVSFILPILIFFSYAWVRSKKNRNTE